MKSRKTHAVRRLSPPQIIILGFFLLILLGTALLMLPIATQDRQGAPLETASFTAVSATCVTGLIIEDTATYWSVFGQAVIITMIQIGGLGFMTMMVLLSMLLGRRISPREQMLVSQSLGLSTNEDMPRLVRRIVTGTFLIEGIGAVLLALRMIPVFGFVGGTLRAAFHSISAFCNAGFDLMGGVSGPYSSIAYFRDDPVVIITFCLLVLLGGIGFIVWDDLVNFIRRRQRFSVYSRFVLTASAVLVFGGTAVIFLLERNNPASIGDLPLGKQLLSSLFQAVTTRTAGFAAIDNGCFTDAGRAFSMFLMFIGGCSGSTAGGVKVGTVCLLFVTIHQIAIGRREIVLYKRRIPQDSILHAISISGVVMGLMLTGAIVISGIDGAAFMDALYETVSAAATVGLSCSLTPVLSPVSHALLMLLMFSGRVGVLTLTYSMTLRMVERKNILTYPDAVWMIG